MELPCQEQEAIPCSVWSATEEPRGLVLMGHGLGADREHVGVQAPMRLLALEHHAVVIAPDLPLHGERNALPSDPMGIVDRWQDFWVAGGGGQIVREFEHLMAYSAERFGALPVAYFGLSLGTQYGIVLLSQHPELRAAVLGLFGSYPVPKTPIMNQHAPRVLCPTYFVQKRDDEIHPAETSTHLFSILGASEKRLDSTEGRHAEVSESSIRDACSFLAEYAFSPA